MLVVDTRVPKLSHRTILRERMQRWMRAYSSSPVRLLIAPAGSGKTTVLLRYAHLAETDVAYCRLPFDCTTEQFLDAIALALNAPSSPTSYSELLLLVCGSPARCVEIGIDDADNASAEVLLLLQALVDDVSPNVTFIYAGRSREALCATSLVARGVADLCDAQRFFFTVEEAMLLAHSAGLEPSELDIRRLVEETDGWAIAVCHTIHRAAAENDSVRRALENWRAESQTFLGEFLTSALDRVNEDDRADFWSLHSGAEALDSARARDLAARGLFVLEEAGGVPRVYRALRPPEARAASSKPTFVSPLNIKLFSSFEATIGGREVPWVRRRDHEIVKYLLLRPDGSATREEIAAVFWPNVDRHLATQSVRTACSTIRKAIAQIVGPLSVDQYFRTVPKLQIDLENVVCDVRRFLAHFNDAEAAIRSGDQHNAERHLRASYKLYRGRLLEHEGEKTWFAPNAHILHGRHLLTLEWLTELALERGDIAGAQLYLSQARAHGPDRLSVLRLVDRLAASGGVAPTVARSGYEWAGAY